MAEAPPPPPQRRGRGNAILTYDTVAEIRQALTRLDLKADVQNDLLLRIEHAATKDLEDHEARLRDLERTVSNLASSRSTFGVLLQYGLSMMAVGISLFALMNANQ